MIKRSLQLAKIGNFQPPAAPKIWRSFQRPVISGVVVTSKLDRIFAIPENFQITTALIVAVTEDKAAIVRWLNENLANRSAVAQRRRERSLDRVRHCAS